MQADDTRLIRCMERASQGKSLTIGFFGGSITQDSLASVHEKCYAYRTYLWWKENFPKADIHYVNAGIGGTDSLYGVSRVTGDMLIYQPNLVFIDFSVNDKPTNFFRESYEGLIRRVLNFPSSPAVVLLHNVRYDNGLTAEPQHGEIGDYYRLPRVSISDTVYQRVQNQELRMGDISPDGLHPNDRGHGLIAKEIIRLLESVFDSWKNQKSASQPLCEGKNVEAAGEENRLMDTVKVDALPHPITENAYQGAKRLTIANALPKLDGFLADPHEKLGHLDHFKNGWIGRRGGDTISFSVEASCIAVQYRKSVCHPARRAELVLDQDTAHPILLDGNFDEEWGDCLYLESILHHGKRGTHTVQIRVLPEYGEESISYVPFYLLSLISA